MCLSYILLSHINFIFTAQQCNNDDNDNTWTDIGTSAQSEIVNNDNLPSATLLLTHNVYVPNRQPSKFFTYIFTTFIVILPKLYTVFIFIVLMEHYWMFWGSIFYSYIVVLSDLSVFTGEVSDNWEPFWIWRRWQFDIWYFIFDQFRIWCSII